MNVTSADVRPGIRQSPATNRTAFQNVKALILGIFLFSILCAVVGAFIPNSMLRSIALSDPKLALLIKGSGFYGVRRDVSPVEAITKVPGRFIHSFSPADVPELPIDLKFKHLQKIQEKRAQALNKGLLVQRPDDFVPVSIRQGDRTIQAKIRLKGDLPDHIQHPDKWSFRVHVKGKKLIFGLKRFSLQHPMVRNFYAEALFFETLRHVGVLAPRFTFARVVLNGNDIGLMAVEEHFSKELIESGGRSESVILKFDETLLWQEASKQVADGGPSSKRPSDNYRHAPIGAFQSSKIRKSAKLNQHYTAAVGLLRGFADRKLLASEVFDVELLGRFIAASELWAARHGLHWNNLRFYFNPITVRLEPIGFDSGSKQPPSDATLVTMGNGGPSGKDVEPIVRDWLGDPRIYKAYVGAMRRLATEVMAGALVENLRRLERKHATVLQKEFFLLDDFSFDKFRERARSLMELYADSS